MLLLLVYRACSCGGTLAPTGNYLRRSAFRKRMSTPLISFDRSPPPGGRWAERNDGFPIEGRFSSLDGDVGWHNYCYSLRLQPVAATAAIQKQPLWLCSGSSRAPLLQWRHGGRKFLASLADRSISGSSVSARLCVIFVHHFSALKCPKMTNSGFTVTTYQPVHYVSHTAMTGTAPASHPLSPPFRSPSSRTRPSGRSERYSSWQWRRRKT